MSCAVECGSNNGDIDHKIITGGMLSCLIVICLYKYASIAIFRRLLCLFVIYKNASIAVFNNNCFNEYYVVFSQRS